MALRKVCDIRNLSTSEKVEINLISFFDYGLLEVGAYFNIDIGQTGDYVDDLSLLEKVTDVRGFTKWVGHKNWVYEEGADSSGVNFPPVIEVDGSGYALGEINYRDGYVYNIPNSATSVRASYSYKWANVTSSRKSGVGRRLQYGYVDNSVNQENMVRLPVVAFEVPPTSSSKLYGLGGTPHIKTYKVRCTIIAENDNDAIRLAEVIANQQNITINTFDPDEVAASGDFPLDFNGLYSSGKTHDQLASLYPWHGIYIKSIAGQNGRFINENLYEAILNINIEILNCGC